MIEINERNMKLKIKFKVFLSSLLGLNCAWRYDLRSEQANGRRIELFRACRIHCNWINVLHCSTVIKLCLKLFKRLRRACGSGDRALSNGTRFLIVSPTLPLWRSPQYLRFIDFPFSRTVIICSSQSPAPPLEWAFFFRKILLINFSTFSCRFWMV